MPRTSIPASVIAQRGRKITLIDGSEALAVCTFSSLMRIEDDFGSVQDALITVRQGAFGKAFNAVAQILAASLEHVERADGGNLGDVEQLRSLLDPMSFKDYSDAVGDAIDAAFPDVADDEAGEGDADPQMDSRGESGTTSPSSSSVDERTSSGA